MYDYSTGGPWATFGPQVTSVFPTDEFVIKKK